MEEHGLGYRLPKLPDPGVTGREYRKIATVWAEQIDTPFVVKTLEGNIIGEAGDYLCKGPNGEMWVVRKDIFENTYKPI